MATKPNTVDNTVENAAEAPTAVDDRVEVYIPKGSANEEPNLFVSVNSVNYLLPKGKTSKVPPHVAYEIKRSLRAQQRQDENIDMMTAKPE